MLWRVTRKYTTGKDGQHKKTQGSNWAMGGGDGDGDGSGGRDGGLVRVGRWFSKLVG